MSERFYAPQLLAGPSVRLDGSEAHHLANVLRLEVGQRVCLFDGNGTEGTAEVTALAKRSAELRVLETRRATEPPEPPLIVATAVPKGDRFRWLVEKATELGVSRLVPLRTCRTVVDPGRGKIEKMRQTVIAACKQSGRNRLMHVDDVISWRDFVDGELSGRSAFIAHRRGRCFPNALQQLDAACPVVVAIGPEGGFTEDELQQGTDAGADLVGLGPNTLRVETAALAAAAAFHLVIAVAPEGGTGG